jgi:hypothetical protein
MKGQAAGMDVLKASSSYFAKDPASVVLTGMVDIGVDHGGFRTGLLDTGGKKLRVPNEGVWAVDKNGIIGFQSDTNLKHPPSAVGYQFRDKMGNESNQGVIIADASLSDVAAVSSDLGKQDDDTFWTNFQTNVTQPAPVMDLNIFITLTSVLADLTRELGAMGEDPVEYEDYKTAYQLWLTAKKALDDPGLLAICRDLVDTATKNTKTKYLARYLRLIYMVRMAAQSLPPDPAN